MFEQTLAVPVRANRAYSTMLGFAAQSLLMTAAVSIPLLFPESLPQVRTIMSIFTPTAPPALPPPAPELPQAPVNRVRPFQYADNVLTAPVRVPSVVQMIDEPPMTVQEAGAGHGNKGGVPGGMPNGIVGGIAGVVAAPVHVPRPPAAQPKPEPAAAPKAVAPRAPVPVGGAVQEAKLVHRVIPPYPLLAKQARIAGRVELTGFIATDGRIRSLKVLSGHPLLIPAALDAVRQWVYQPTLLNGEPVEVVAPITVHFVLN